MIIPKFLIRIKINSISIEYKWFYKLTNNGFGHKPNKQPAGLLLIRFLIGRSENRNLGYTKGLSI